jgi:DNA-binding response OmpR family regulator
MKDVSLSKVPMRHESTSELRQRKALPAVLIVDDDQTLVDSLEEVLVAEGHGVRTAPDGRAALDEIHERRPDLILLDIEMPKLSGPAMIRRLEGSDSRARNIPVILMSGEPRLGVVAEVLGARYFLKKPFSIEVLLRTIEAALRGAKGNGDGAETS